MSAPTWYFREMDRGEINIDPIQREFFTTEALEGLADAVVRETIQNSLDAAQEGKKVSVRFCLSGPEAATGYRHVLPFFANLWAHLGAKTSGLAQIPREGDPVPFLVVEDFQTHGLIGDPAQESDVDGEGKKNDFYYFWRNVGRSGKEQKDRGRWGLGKTVFPASSRINTFFGLSIREEEPRRLLMGQAVLKVHSVDGNRRYPYGYFGVLEDGQFAMPIADAGLINEFASRFGLERKNDPGLSLVIPFPQPEITHDEMVKAVVRQFFYPILSGSLTVVVGRRGGERVLDDSTLFPTLETMHEGFRREITPLAKLAEWACDLVSDAFVSVNELSEDTAPKWSTELLPPELLPGLRTRFDQGERVAFRVPVWVRPASGRPAKSSFHLFIQRDLAMGVHRPRYIREGIIVSDAVRRSQHAVYALVVIDDKPLATLLGDAENPAHTEWQERSANFRDRYHHGASVLRFVKNSVAEVVQMVSHSDEAADPGALLDIFFLPEASEQDQLRPSPKPQPRPGPETVGEEPVVTGKKEKFRISKVKGGFTVRQAEGVSELPDAIEIRVAYEVRRGSPLKKYQPADFELDRPPITIQKANAEVGASRNCLLIEKLQPNFSVTVSGFDAERDLVVRGVVREPKHDSQI